jgi:hypothetical protein
MNAHGQIEYISKHEIPFEKKTKNTYFPYFMDNIKLYLVATKFKRSNLIFK